MPAGDRGLKMFGGSGTCCIRFSTDGKEEWEVRGYGFCVLAMGHSTARSNFSACQWWSFWNRNCGHARPNRGV